jgi:hypothetical protein
VLPLVLLFLTLHRESQPNGKEPTP